MVNGDGAEYLPHVHVYDLSVASRDVVEAVADSLLSAAGLALICRQVAPTIELSRALAIEAIEVVIARTEVEGAKPREDGS